MDNAPSAARARKLTAGSRPERQLLYYRLPGLLALSARQERPDAATVPLVVAEGWRVRDACPLAVARGISSGMSVNQARRIAPLLLVLPLETISHQRHTTVFLDLLADD